MNLKLVQRVVAESGFYNMLMQYSFQLEREMKLQKRMLSAELTVLRQRRAIGATWIERESAISHSLAQSLFIARSQLVGDFHHK